MRDGQVESEYLETYGGGKYGAKWNKSNGMIYFERLQGRGPLPESLRGAYTATQFTDAAYNAYVRSKDKPAVKQNSFVSVQE